MEKRKGLHKQVRLKDIANRTGYSINTVSHALRGIDDIGEETRNLILKTAQELGYAREVKEFKANPEAYKAHVGDVSTVLRIALTGRANTPDMYEIMAVLGKDSIIKRFRSIIQ